MADETRRDSTDVVHRTEGAADRRLGRAVLRQADFDRRRDGDPARIEDAAATPTAPKLDSGEPTAEREKRQQANVAAGLGRDRIDEGALTPTPEVDAEKVRVEREKVVRLAEENKRAGLAPTRIEAGALTPMPSLPGGMRTTHPDAAMGAGEKEG